MLDYLTPVLRRAMRPRGFCVVVLFLSCTSLAVGQSAYEMNTYAVTLNPPQNAARMCGVNKNAACPSDLSSYHGSSEYVPSMGNDGSSNTFAHTNNGVTATAANPNFYVVDFQQQISPSSVVVSITHYAHRMGGASLRLGDSAVWSQNPVCASALAGVGSQTVSCSLTGRYMFLVGKVSGTDPFAVSELQVFISSTCAACPLESSAPVAAAAACFCGPGYSGPVTACVACPKDTFKNTSGSHNCAP